MAGEGLGRAAGVAPPPPPTGAPLAGALRLLLLLRRELKKLARTPSFSLAAAPAAPAPLGRGRKVRE